MIPFSPSVRHYKTDTSTSNSLKVGTIINFQNAGQGKIWVGAFDGLRIFDSRTGKMEAFSQNDLPAGLKRTGIMPSLIDTIVKKAYLSWYNGIWAMDMNTKKCQPLIFKDSANHEVNIVEYRDVSRLKDGLLITAILDNRQSIFRINTDSEIAHEILSFPVNSIDLDTKYAFDDGYMFLRRPGVSGNLTYTYLNNKWTRSLNPLDSIHWSRIAYDEKRKAIG